MSPSNPPSRTRDAVAHVLILIGGLLLVTTILLGIFLIFLPSAPQEGLSKFEAWSYQHQADKAHQRRQSQGADK